MRAQVLRGAEEAFYLVDLSAAIERVELWKALLPQVEPFYAVKCNPDPTLLRTLAQAGLGFDCASRVEMQAVLSLGVTPDRILYANPCKQPSHLRFASEVGVPLSVIDSESELQKTADIDPDAEVLLRIGVDDSQSQCVMSNKYGATLEEVPRLLAQAKKLGVTIRGVSFHVGSGCYQPQSFADAVERAADVFEQASALGMQLDVLDVGGGFPGSDSDRITFKDIASSLSGALEQHFPPERGVRLIAEPGRFIAEATSTFACNVIGKKVVAPTAETGPHNMYYINDGLYGSFNCILYDHATPQCKVLLPKGLNEPIDAAAEDTGGGAAEESEAKPNCSIWGPTCDGFDCVAKEATLPELSVGSWVYFENMGAYTAAAGSTFNGIPMPDKVYVGGYAEAPPRTVHTAASSFLQRAHRTRANGRAKEAEG